MYKDKKAECTAIILVLNWIQELYIENSSRANYPGDYRMYNRYMPGPGNYGI